MAGRAARLVHRLKYAGWTELARPMGGAMADPARRLIRLARLPMCEVVLVPVPITPSRRRERGFNQAALLAEALACSLALPLEDLLERRRARSSQVRLPRRERLANVREGFRLRHRAACERGGPVLLVDDVVTSGATAAACSAALFQGGWVPIGLVSFARAWQSLDPSGGFAEPM